MPQFNWSILGPLLLIIIIVTAGTGFVLSRVSHMPLQPEPSAAARSVTAADAATAGALGTPSGGVRLSGRVRGTPHLRSEPSSTAIVLQDLQIDETVEVSACSPSCGWYLVSASRQPSPGWVSAAFINVQGDDRKLIVIK